MRLMLTLLLSYCLAASPGDIIIKIPPGINLEEREVRANLPENIKIGGLYERIEIVIYYFSQGVEKLSYRGKNSLQESMMAGEIRALIKLKKKNVLIKALFITASGINRDQILISFSRKFTEIIAKQ
jgi:hypothetical protein